MVLHLLEFPSVRFTSTSAMSFLIYRCVDLCRSWCEELSTTGFSQLLIKYSLLDEEKPARGLIALHMQLVVITQ